MQNTNVKIWSSNLLIFLRLYFKSHNQTTNAILHLLCFRGDCMDCVWKTASLLPPTLPRQKRARCQRVRDILQSPAPFHPQSSRRASSPHHGAPSSFSPLSMIIILCCLKRRSHSLRLGRRHICRPCSSSADRLGIFLSPDFYAGK